MAKEEPVSHENGEEETSKRRKHHHHHSRSHHRHRSKHRHSKHGKHKEDEHQLPSPAIRLDEKEEGEIFDDEIFDYEKLTKKADSEIESGEIKPDEESSDAKIDDSCVDQIIGSDGDTLLGTPGNMLDLDQHQIDSRDQSPRGLPTLKEGNDDKDGTSDRIHGGLDGRDMMQDDNVSDGSPQMRILEESRKDVDIFADMNNGHLVSGNKGHTLKENDGGMELMNDSRKRDHLHDGFNHGVVSVGGNSEGEGWRDLSGNRNSTKSDNSLRKKDGHSGGGDIEASRSRGKSKESPEVEYKPRKHGESSPRARKSNDVNGHSGGADIEASRLRGKVKESPEVEYKPRKHEESSPRIRKSNDVNGEIDHRSELHRHVGSKSKSPSRDDEKELFCRGSDSAIDGHSGSRSPRARERSDSKKNTNRDDRDADPSSRRYDRKSADPVDINRDSSVNKNRSLSPESLRNKHKTRVRSPSYDRYHAEGRSRKRSRSHDRLRELIPQSRAVHSPERDSKRSKNSDRARPSDLRHHRFDDRENRHGSRDRIRDMDRERLRDRGIGRYRERSSSYNRLTGEDTLDGRDRDMDRGRDRDRNRDRDAPLDRDRDRERAKDGDRGREMQRDRDRERDWERNRDRDRNAASRRHKYDDHDFNHGGRDRFRDSGYRRYDELEYERDRPRKKESANDLGSKRHNTEVGKEKATREEDEQEDYQERVVLQLAEHEEEDVNRIKEESRKRRQAILEKYKQQQSQVQVESFPQDDGKDEKEPGVDRKPRSSSSIEKSPSIHPVNHALPESIDNKHDSSDIYVADPSFTVGKSPLQNGTSAIERTSGAGGLGEGSPKSEISKDMFCDDIFGESPAGVRKLAKGDGLHVERSGLHDNWDDAEGYYSYRIGEVLDGRYEVTAAHGKGVFSTVVRATDLKAGKADPEEVAIKIIRNNETMYKAGLEELIILKKLVGADPDDKRHCVKFLSSFKYRNHLCLVFESLHMNLRDVLKKFGRNIGLKLTAVRAYAKQLFIALKHLRNCGVLHCDIKPDNMLVNEAKNVLKLCDFGNAMFAGKNEITPYLVSRFYRAPEIILGLPYDHPMDVWSVGCCLYELYLGKVLFPGPSNNEMLRLHMELKGPFPKKMLKKGAFCDQHFDQDLNFYATEEDSITKKAVKRLLINIKPKYIGSLISGSSGEDPKMLADFKDLLERIFVLDPEKRMTVSQALSHPFITGK